MQFMAIRSFANQQVAPGRVSPTNVPRTCHTQVVIVSRRRSHRLALVADLPDEIRPLGETLCWKPRTIARRPENSLSGVVEWEGDPKTLVARAASLLAKGTSGVIENCGKDRRQTCLRAH